MDVDRGRMFSLNASGSAMFELLGKGLAEETIIGELAARFEIPASLAQQDLDEFRKTLHRHALVPGAAGGTRE